MYVHSASVGNRYFLPVFLDATGKSLGGVAGDVDRGIARMPEACV
jgi:hypothetical protein